MKNKIIATVLLALSAVFTAPVYAATIEFNDSDIEVIGISGINVEGYGVWDATFNSEWQGDFYTDIDFVIATGNAMLDLFTDGGQLQGSDLDLLVDSVYNGSGPCNGGEGGNPCIGLTVVSIENIFGIETFVGGAFLNYGNQYGTNDHLDQLYHNEFGELDLMMTDSNQDGVFVSWTQVSPVPEPSTLALMLAGFGLIGFKSRRRNKLSA